MLSLGPMQVVSPVRAHTSPNYSKMWVLGWNGLTETYVLWMVCSNFPQASSSRSRFVLFWETPEQVLYGQCRPRKIVVVDYSQCVRPWRLAGVVIVVHPPFSAWSRAIFFAASRVSAASISCFSSPSPYPLQLLHLLSVGACFANSKPASFPHP